MDNLILIGETNAGDFVACDFCNYGEDTMGGALIGSYAVCGDCCKDRGILDDAYEYKDEITEVFDQDKTFRENVLNFRLREYGTPDAITKIYRDKS